MKTGILFFLLISVNVFSQDIKEIIAKETCECIAKVDIDSMSSSDLELNFGLCMLESYNNHLGEFAENEKLDFLNNAQMEKFGEDIAIKMLVYCPDIIMMLGDSYNDAPASKDRSIEGVFNGTSLETFFNVIIKDSTGKTNHFVLLDYFENAYLITDNLLKYQEAVKVSYYEAELFDAKSNKFITSKIITNITKK
jgi:hypothetical protein